MDEPWMCDLYDSKFNKVLEVIDYDNLKGWPWVCEPCQHQGTNKKQGVASLVDWAAESVVRYTELVARGVRELPTHTVTKLFKSAVQFRLLKSIEILVSEWPMETLAVQRICPFLEDEDMVLNGALMIAIKSGLLRRNTVKEHVRLTCLDLTGFNLSYQVTKLLTLVLPVLTLRKEDNVPEKILSEITNFVQNIDCLQQGGEESYVDILRALAPVVQWLVKFAAGSEKVLYVPPGKTLTIKCTNIAVCDKEADQMNALDCLILGGLTNLIPYTLQIKHVHLELHQCRAKSLVQSCLPILALFGLKGQALKGIQFYGLLDDQRQFTFMIESLRSFPNLHALDLGGAFTAIGGSTRQITLSREKLAAIFGNLTQLTRLDLSTLSFNGHLKDLLEALQTPLHYLNLLDAEVNEEDFDYLSACKHTTSLKELRFACSHFGLTCVSKMTDGLLLLELECDFGDELLKELCETILKFKKLRALKLLVKFYGDPFVRLVETCCNCPQLQTLILWVCRLGPQSVGLNRRSLQRMCQDVVTQYQRPDMQVELLVDWE